MLIMDSTSMVYLIFGWKWLSKTALILWKFEI